MIVIGTTIFIFGMSFLVCGLGIYINNSKKKKNCTQHVKGTIKKVRTSTKLMGSADDEISSYIKTDYPTFEYTVGETTYEKASNIGSMQGKLKVGEEVDIYYNPNNPDEYYVPSITTTKTVSKIFIGAGLLICFIGICLLIISKSI